jgi:hypothetical protein
MRAMAGTYEVSIGQSSANLPINVQVKVPSTLTEGLNAEGQSAATTSASVAEKDAIMLPECTQSAFAHRPTTAAS